MNDMPMIVDIEKCNNLLGMEASLMNMELLFYSKIGFILLEFV